MEGGRKEGREGGRQYTDMIMPPSGCRVYAVLFDRAALI